MGGRPGSRPGEHPATRPARVPRCAAGTARGWLHVPSGTRHRRPGRPRPPPAWRDAGAPPRRGPRRRARGLLADPAVGQPGGPHARPERRPAFRLAPPALATPPPPSPCPDPGRRSLGEARPPRRAARSARRLPPSPAAPTRWTRQPGSGSGPRAPCRSRRSSSGCAWSRRWPTRVTAAADGRSAVLRPAAPLEPGASYRFTLLDPAGAPLTGWAFQVAGPPRVVGTTPPEREHRRPGRRPGSRSRSTRTAWPWSGATSRCGSCRREPPVAGAIEMHGRAAVFVPGEQAPRGPRLRGPGPGRHRGDRAGRRAGPRRDLRLPDRADGAGRGGPGGARPGVRHGAPGRARAARGAPVDDHAGRRRDEVTTPVPLRVYRLAGEAAAIRALEQLLGTPAWAGAGARPARPHGRPRRASSRDRPRSSRDGWEAALRLPIAPRAGWYLVELRQGPTSQAVLQVTDIAAMAGVREDRFVAWVNDARAGRPVQGAPVDVVGGPRIGRTDARACWLPPTPAAAPRHEQADPRPDDGRRRTAGHRRRRRRGRAVPVRLVGPAAKLGARDLVDRALDRPLALSPDRHDPGVGLPARPRRRPPALGDPLRVWRYDGRPARRPAARHGGRPAGDHRSVGRDRRAPRPSTRLVRPRGRGGRRVGSRRSGSRSATSASRPTGSR